MLILQSFEKLKFVVAAFSAVVQLYGSISLGEGALLSDDCSVYVGSLVVVSDTFVQTARFVHYRTKDASIVAYIGSI